ncbi:MAG: cysteine desulfurase family protein [Bacteroidetes bacterium]|nr:cysteine desulfurase family protein [Bacteroidota bacterium]
MKVYFDNAATTPVAEEVLQELSDVLRSHYGNPSSIHQQGRDARSLVELARKKIATCIGAQSSEIVFTAGGTEADNLAIHAAIHDLGVNCIITSSIEHSAVYNSIKKQKEAEVLYVKFSPQGEIDLAHLEELLKSATGKVLVSLMHVNNEIGTILPLDKVSALCLQYAALFHSDTVQSIGHLPLNLSATKIDFVTCSAHKLHGLKGTGFLYVSKKNKISAQIIGGGQERDIRGGTENVPGIVSMGKALSMSCAAMEEDAQKVKGLKDYFYKELQAIGAMVNGSFENASPYILNVSLPKTSSSSMLLFNLDIEGIAVSGGSACSSGSHLGSRVLTELGVDSEVPAVRFSFSRYNTKEEVDFVIEKLKKICK